ncbi:MAG: hypothetical protein ABIJ34_00105 [archaeon]
MLLDDLSAVRQSYGAFAAYAPAHFCNSYVLRNWQGTYGHFKKYPLESLLTNGSAHEDNVLLEYRMNGSRFPIFTESDFYSIAYASDTMRTQIKGNISGIIVERITWETTLYWLSHIAHAQIDEREYKQDHIFGDAANFILKVLTPPRMLILKKKTILPGEKQKDLYSSYKELDGLILCSVDEERYVVVIESKKRHYKSMRSDEFESRLVTPLKEIYPDAKIVFVSYSDMNSLYLGGSGQESRIATLNAIKEEPLKLTERLLRFGVGTVLFGIREDNATINGLADHILDLRDQLQDKPVWVRALDSQTEVKLFGKDRPYRILCRANDGRWDEKPVKRKH